MDFEQFDSEQRRLKSLLFNKKTFDEGLALCAGQNRQLHEKDEARDATTIWDGLIAGLEPGACSYRPEGEFESIAWCVWHITRIEDAIGNILIADGEQVFDETWKKRIGVSITDTANAFGEADVDAFSRAVDMRELLAYRKLVGQRSREVIASVARERIRTKPKTESVERIMAEGVLTEERSSYWLKDFWANKTIGGLLLLPITRHQMMHIPNCFRLKGLWCEGKAETSRR